MSLLCNTALVARPRRALSANCRGRTATIPLIVVTALIAGAALAFFVRWDISGNTTTEATAAPTAAPASAVDAATGSPPVQDLVMPLAQRLAANPDDPSSWVLLGKSYDYLGKPGLAANAYRQAMHYGNDDPKVAKALRDAEDALVLSAMSTPQASPAAATLPAATLPAATMPPAGAVPVAVNGRVSIDDTLRQRVAPGQAVFIYAKEVDGPPMPLAVMRSTSDLLPLDFTLDDSTAMTAGRALSDASQVIVIARVSPSGNATTQPGDLIGETSPLDPRTDSLANVTIDRVVGEGR